MRSHSALELLVCLAASLTLAWLMAGCSDHGPRYRTQIPAHGRPGAEPGRILFVLSAADEQVLQNGKRRATGNFLSEFYEPYLALTQAGYTITLATPDGRTPSLDPESLNDKYWAEAPSRRIQARALLGHSTWRRPLSLAAALEAEPSFQGMLVPGGQGLMVDLLEDARVHVLIRRFAASDRPLGLVCHAPALLTRVPDGHTLSQRRVTSVSGFEEFYIERFVMGGKAAVRNIGERLEAAGYEHETAFPGRAHALRDCSLVTSQNPFSGRDFNRLFLAALRDFRLGARCVPHPRPEH